MAYASAIRCVLRRHLHDPSSSFSIGSFGAIAEFHRATEEPLVVDNTDRLTVATARGGLRIDFDDSVLPIAYETLSRREGRWQHGVVFCLPKDQARSHGRDRLTELGPDDEAVFEQDRAAVLFDMGLAARNVDFCVRTGDPALLAILRANEGRSLFDPANPAMGAILEASPHRIALSKLGRAEVYQAIGKDATPEGPHTHVLPKFLKSGRTHSANIPVPSSHLPCLSLYPANPLSDAMGRARPFNEEDFTAFEALLDLWGHADYRTEKERTIEAFYRKQEPADYRTPGTRLGRTALRVALRQLRQLEGDSDRLTRWLAAFDAGMAKAQKKS